MAPPSDADAVATAPAAERPAHHPVAHAAAVPEQRRRWMDLLRLVLRYVGNGVGQVLRLMVLKNSGEPRDAGVVVTDKLLQARDGAGLVVDELHNDKGPDAIKKSREERHEAGVVVTDKLLQARDGAGLVVDELHNDKGPDAIKKSQEERHEAGVVVNRDNAVTNMNVDTRTAAKRNQAWIYQNFRTRAIPFVMVGNYRVYKEHKDLYAMYCQEKPSSGRRQLCHMCISEQIYFNNKFPPNGMLKHCCQKHKAGIECTEPDCRVRLPTEEERSLHINFCHRLPAGWWDWEEYKALDK